MLAVDIKESFVRWATRKQRAASNSITLDRKRIYILPTRYGLLYGLMLFIMLMGSIHYSNSMAFLLTFLLAGMGSLAMWQTHRNLLGLTLEKQMASPAFVGEDIRFKLRISNPSNESRHALVLQSNDAPLTLWKIDAKNQQIVHLLIPAKKRGWISPGRFRIYTRFPVGLFHSWSWLEFNWSTIVYPRPVKTALPFHLSDTEGQGSGQTRQGTEDFSGLREYRAGDSSRHIAWKTMAHTEHPMTKQFSSSSIDELWLDWDGIDEPNRELRISMLTYQVLEASRLNLEYGLRLPSAIVSPGVGEPHKYECLKVLALQP